MFHKCAVGHHSLPKEFFNIKTWVPVSKRYSSSKTRLRAVLYQMEFDSAHFYTAWSSIRATLVSTESDSMQC